MQINQKLLIAAIALMALSVFSYYRSIARADRFERGQKFLTQLNSDNINTIEIQKDGDVVTLKRGEENFSITERFNYPAKNDAVNRFIKDMLAISLEKPVGEGDSLEQELGLGGGEDTMTVALKDDSDKVMVTFVVGKSAESGGGNYIKRADGDDGKIYLTSRGIFLSNSVDSFIRKDLLDVPVAQVQSIKGGDYSFQRDDSDAMILQGVPAGKKENSDASQMHSALGGLRFEKVYRGDEAEVQGLNFSKSVTYALKDDSSYQLSLAQKDDKTYLTVRGDFNEAKVREAADAQEIRAADDDTLKDKSEVLTRYQEIQQFNEFHQGWIYELSDFTGKKFLKTKAELIENIEKEGE